MILSSKRQRLLGLAFILLVAAAMRFINLDSAEFWYDEATLSILAQDMAAGKSLPLLGIPASVGVPNPPIGVYLLAIPYFFSKNPLVATAFVALLNVIGVALLWRIAERLFGTRVAFITGLIYALSPWAVLYSRKIWGQDFHTPLILAGFLLGLVGFIDGKRWAQVVCLPILVAAMQIHFAAWALLPAYTWLLWIGRSRVSYRAAALSVILALLTLIPFIVGITGQGTSYGSGGIDVRGLTALPLQHILWLITGLGMGETFLFPSGVEFVSQYPIVAVLWLTTLPLLALGVWAAWRKSRPYALWLLLWGFAPPLLLLIGVFHSQPHYFIPCIPVYCLLIAYGIVWLAERHLGRLSLRPVVLAAATLIGVTYVVDWRSFLAFTDTHYIEEKSLTRQSYTTPLRYYLDIRPHLKREVILMAGSLAQVLPIQWTPLLYDDVDCLREAVIADGGVAVLPAHPFSLLRAPNAAPYEFASLYASASQTTFPLREGEGSYTLDQIEAPPTWTDPALTPIDSARFDNGVLLNGYAFANGRLYLDWNLTRQNALDYQYFAHLLNANGERIAQRDASFYPGKYWCTGDRLVTWIAMDRPPEVALLRVGFYHLRDGAIIGVNQIDAAGNAVAPWVDIPLVKEN